MNEALEFVVFGQQQTAGSKRAFARIGANGRPFASVVDDNPKTKNWQAAVAQAAAVAMRCAGSTSLLEGPLVLCVVFTRVRPAGHFGKRGLNKTGLENPWPHKKPDLLKLARAIEDALTGVVWRDDAQIVREVLEKRWGECCETQISVVAAIETT